jgi:hypothetical protein
MNVSSDIVLDKDEPFFEHEGKRYMRFDKIEVVGYKVRFFWRGELLLTQLPPSFNAFPTLTIEGIFGVMEYKLI